MKITDNIAENLSSWMEGHPKLGTIKLLSEKSKVGFGTVRRVKNGDGNPTITNLYDIAQAFGKRIEDLLAPVNQSDNVVKLTASDAPPPAYSSELIQLISLANAMDERGKWQLIGMAKVLAQEYPENKSSKAS